MALKKLHSSDYHVADDSTDIRGWKLHDTSGSVIGKVDDLMFDPDAKEVRYALVELDGGRQVNIPIGQISLDEHNHRVTATGYDRERLSTMREHTKDTVIDDTVERDYYRDHNPDWKGDTLDYSSEQYRGNMPQRIQLVEEQLNVGKREVETGHVTLGKRAVSEQVSEQVELGQERLEINRKAVNKPVEGAAAIGDNQTINVTLFGEEAVAGKQAFIKEEIDVNKVRDTRTENITETLRHEELVTEGMDQHEFASAEPTQADMLAKRRYETEQTERVDITPIDDPSRIDRPI
ncbi:MAG: DUF2382 domain-containing protein [Candidatus Sericytochromatia bacterium]